MEKKRKSERNIFKPSYLAVGVSAVWASVYQPDRLSWGGEIVFSMRLLTVVMLNFAIISIIYPCILFISKKVIRGNKYERG
jgi:hypothetical protein